MAYPGGKGGAFQHLINRIPPHRIYVEAYFGGGAVFRHKRPAIHSIGIDLDLNVLQGLERRRDFHALHGDAIQLLPKLDLGPSDFVYCDPPYLPSTRRGGRLYLYDANEEHHVLLLDVVQNLRCQVMLSGYKNSLYEAKLATWRTETFTAASRMGSRVESVWMNYSITTLHDTRYLGSTFREREQFKRKRLRWRRQFARLTPLHQQAIYEDLQGLRPQPQAIEEGATGVVQLTLPGFNRSVESERAPLQGSFDPRHK